MSVPGRHFFLAVIAYTAFTSSAAFAQPTGAITGRVIDASSGQPVPSAEVEIVIGRRTTTATDGTFHFQGLAAGPRELTVRRLGFLPERVTVLVPDTTIRVDIRLTPVPAELPGVSVTAPEAHLGGFWDRQRKGMGKFFTREDLDRRKPTKLADMFRGVDGAKVVPTVHGYGVASQRGTRELTGADCMAAVFLNGMPFRMSSAGLNDVDPDDVEAIEYYSSSARIPAQFNAIGSSRPATGFITGHPKCGVVAIWTRGRR